MSKKFSIYLESGLRNYNSLKNYRRVAEEVKKIVLSRWEGVKVYVFGSVPRGRFTASSDLDILIVLGEKRDEEEIYRMKALVYSKIDTPIELHIVSEDEMEKWYKRFIEPDNIEEI